MLDGSSSETGTISNNSSVALTIGAWIGDGSGYSTSVIDGFKVFNRVLTEAEIQAEIGPIAVAGADFSVNEGDLATLDGTGSAPAGITYAWSQVPSPTVTLTGANTATPSFTAPSVAVGGATLTFELTVTLSNAEELCAIEGGFCSFTGAKTVRYGANGVYVYGVFTDGVSCTNGIFGDPIFGTVKACHIVGSMSAMDEVNVRVVNVNRPPVADAGPDQSIAEGSPVTLDGSASYDSDTDPISYAWVQVGGLPMVTLDLTNPAKPTFTGPFAGAGGAPGVVATLEFELTVSDGFVGGSASDRVKVDITNVNNNPAANAGVDQTVNENILVTLTGVASSDPDSDPLTYAWTQLSGPLVTLSNANAQQPTFTAPFVSAGGAVLTFELKVNDSYVDSAPDTVVVNVQNINDPPLASAARPSLACLWPPNHGMGSVSILGVTDPNNNATITITGVTQDEPTNGLGDGDTAIDAIINGTVLLRAERSGKGNGRVYRISFTASDFEGSTSGAVNVCVPHSVKSVAVDSGQNYNSTN